MRLNSQTSRSNDVITSKKFRKDQFLVDLFNASDMAEYMKTTIKKSSRLLPVCPLKVRTSEARSKHKNYTDRDAAFDPNKIFLPPIKMNKKLSASISTKVLGKSNSISVRSLYYKEIDTPCFNEELDCNKVRNIGQRHLSLHIPSSHQNIKLEDTVFKVPQYECDSQNEISFG